MTADLLHRIKPYSGWAALVLLVAGLFSGLVGSKFAVPLTLLIGAIAFATLRFWDELKTFDFWDVDEWARMRYDAYGVTDWRSTHQAAEIYCSKVVAKARNEAAAEMNTIMMELIRSQERSAAVESVNFNDTAASAPNRSERNAKYDAAQVRFNQCNTALAREMLAYLMRGDLLAKGLPTDGETARSERIIPTSRWRVMNLDIAKAKAEGQGWHYAGLVVAPKPKPRPKAPKPSAPAAPAPAAEAAPQPADKSAVRVPPPRSDLPRPPKPTA